jgi:hypothetical protein
MAEDKDNQYVAGKTEKILSPREYTGEPNTGYGDVNQFNLPNEKANVGSEYPISKGPRYTSPKPREIGTPFGSVDNQKERIWAASVDHRLGAGSEHRRPNDFFGFDENGNPIYGQKMQRGVHSYDKDGNPVIYNEPEFFIKNRLDHYVRDVPQGLGGEHGGTEPFVDTETTVTRTGYPNGSTSAKTLGVFSGATTNVNALNKPVAAEILKAGTYGKYEDDRVAKISTNGSPPISADYNAYRMNKKNDENLADASLFNAYNRTHIPIADQEWRKGFRYIFFTRPECYLMFRSGNEVDLCNQAYYDEDFASAYSRMPHIIKLLSPWYVSGSFPNNNISNTGLVGTPDGANWNFLFSNRVDGMGVAPSSMTVQETIAKSIEGYTVTPAEFVDSRQGSQIDLTFTDTRNLEVFEMARLWMLYMYKRQKGIFLPPYNGYAQENSFLMSDGASESKLSGPLKNAQYTRMHPYDRALEYCASMYDIVTNETGTKILYWCKYYGIYPVSAAPSLDNTQNGPITSVQTSISFKYHYRLENNNKTLVEFNHDAGLTDAIGKQAVSSVYQSMPFLYRDDDPKGNSSDPTLPKYLGAAGMFTGSPFIVMQQTRSDPLDKAGRILTPELRFMSLPNAKNYEDLNKKLNLNIVNSAEKNISRNVVAYTSLVSDAKVSVSAAGKAIAKAMSNLL